MTDHTAIIERMARAMCETAGLDAEDRMANGGPRWRYYEPQAQAALRVTLSSDVEEKLRLARLCEAITPSCETKAAYMGEFSFLIDDYDEDGEEHSRKITVPWDTVKEIMAAIRARSAVTAAQIMDEQASTLRNAIKGVRDGK